MQITINKYSDIILTISSSFLLIKMLIKSRIIVAECQTQRCNVRRVPGINNCKREHGGERESVKEMHLIIICNLDEFWMTNIVDN